MGKRESEAERLLRNISNSLFNAELALRALASEAAKDGSLSLPACEDYGKYGADRETTLFRTRPRLVQAMRMTETNFEEVRGWLYNLPETFTLQPLCEGAKIFEIHDDEGEKLSHMVFFGTWLVYRDETIEFYYGDSFARNFEPYSGEEGQ
jgi:hypothetical protein